MKVVSIKSASEFTIIDIDTGHSQIDLDIGHHGNKAVFFFPFS